MSASSSSSTLARAASAAGAALLRGGNQASSSSAAPAAAAAAAVASASLYSTNVRDAGGAFSKKEAAVEDKFIHDHDKELLERLKKDLANKPAPAPAAASEAAPASPAPAAASSSTEGSADPAKINISPIDSGYGGAVRGGGGALGKKEAAIEEKYFRDLDKEKLDKIKKH
ncbi:hypothetical protein DFJ73DRAFT_796822 [Zopfochytrium polystomum]|nr:hypothetical protein DFJ73DRAFT_796822 [Zopfochytrium polystomum]